LAAVAPPRVSAAMSITVFLFMTGILGHPAEGLTGIGTLSPLPKIAPKARSFNLTFGHAPDRNASGFSDKQLI
jgi:hypothetical protein